MKVFLHISYVCVFVSVCMLRFACVVCMYVG